MESNRSGSGRGAAGGKLCGGRLRDGSDDTCEKQAGWGTDHVGIGRCRLHGGNTASHRANAVKVEGAREVARLGGRKDIHPAAALLELVQYGAVTVEYWRGVVAALPEDDLTWGVTEEVDSSGGEGGGFSSTKREAKPHIALVLLRAAEQDLAAYASAALKAGVDAALVSVAQVHANRLIAVVDHVLADERVTVDGEARVVVLEALREVMGT